MWRPYGDSMFPGVKSVLIFAATFLARAGLLAANTLQSSESRSSPLAKIAVRSVNLSAEVSLGLGWGPPSWYLWKGGSPSELCHYHTLNSHTYLPCGQDPPLWLAQQPPAASIYPICPFGMHHIPDFGQIKPRLLPRRAQASHVSRADGIFPCSSCLLGQIWILHRSTMGDRLLLGWHLRYGIAETIVAVVLGIMYRETPSFFQCCEQEAPQLSLHSRSSVSASLPSIWRIQTSVWVWKSIRQMSQTSLRTILC